MLTTTNNNILILQVLLLIILVVLVPLILNILYLTLRIGIETNPGKSK